MQLLLHQISKRVELSFSQSAYRWKQKFLSYICMYAYICISQSGISSWNSNTSLLKNRPGCWLLSFPFRPVLNTQTSMLMGNPWGPATFVPALRGCLSLGTGWQPPGCLLLDNQHVVRYWSQSSRGMPAGCQALIGIWWAEDWRLSWFPFCLFVFFCLWCTRRRFAIFLGERKVRVWRRGALSCSRWSVCVNKDLQLMWWTTVGVTWGCCFCLKK